MMSTLRRLVRHPSLILPFWLYTRLNIRIGLSTHHVGHYFFGRRLMIACIDGRWLVGRGPA